MMTRTLRCLLLGLVVALVCAHRPASAQTAPAGNEHPRELADRAAAGTLPNPFGPAAPSGMDTGKKEAFSKAIDLSPLRDLAVYEDGRVKILDTLAREIVGRIVGRRDYVDLDIQPGASKARNVHYDPLFTLLDLCIDPGYYVDRPLVHVQYLPLREEFLGRMYQSESEREWWKRLGRLKPIELIKHIDAIEQKRAFEGPIRQGLESVRGALVLYQIAPEHLLMVASDSADKPWNHLSTLPADTAAAKACRELGEAWRSANAARVNAAAKSLASELPKINGQYYPQARRALEAAYNRVNAFEWGYWMYALSLLLFLLAFGTGRSGLAGAGTVVFLAALALHAFGFISRCIIAERFAIQNQFESMTGLSLFAAVVGCVLMLARKQWLFGAAAAGVGFMVLITATQTGIPGVSVEREAPILNTSVLLKYHVTTVLVSYGLISLGFMVSLFYLGTHYATRVRTTAGAQAQVAMPGGSGGVAMVDVSASALGIDGDPALAGRARVLSDLDKAQMIILQLAFWALGVGILLGAWWADHSWGRWWAFDPKELWALVTWIVYLIVIHVRVAGGVKNRGLVTAWLSVVGFIVMLWTYFGVNLLLPGLHAYA